MGKLAQMRKGGSARATDTNIRHKSARYRRRFSVLSGLVFVLSKVIIKLTVLHSALLLKEGKYRDQRNN
jgi:hypothetical protein